MNYTFKIIDTQRNDLTTLVERAVGSSIILEWLGGDRKDELFIVGSRLSFTMVGMNMEDGQYLDLFTGDETRYRVTQEDENGNMIWQGFLLPDSYSEPYTNAPILVDFTATDGLGRLKGKYLSEDFYKDEKSVIEIISSCLRLTGLDLNFRFAPAIENSIQKDYNQIYIDTELFKSNDKKDDAYKILNELLESMLCTVYQADNFYNIEGLNVRNLRVYEAKIYAPDGTLIGTSEITRKSVNITGIATPYVDMQAPYGVVNINFKQEPLTLPKGLSTETNDGWSILGKVQRFGEEAQEQEVDKQRIHATEWYGHDDFYAYAGVEKDPVVFFGIDNGGYISIRNRPYIEKGRKYELKINFEIENNDAFYTEEDWPLILDAWKNPFEFFVLISSDSIGFDPFGFKSLLFYNSGTGGIGIDISFNREKKSENILQFTAPHSGLLDIRMRGVSSLYDYQDYYRDISAIKITEASLDDLGYEEEYFTQKILTEDYTAKKEIYLVYGDDPTGMSRAFRLQKLKEPNNSVTIDVPVIQNITFQGKYYAVVNLLGANLIKENLKDNDELKSLISDVIYNFNESQDHVVETKQYSPSSSFSVTLRDYNDVTEVRDYWRQWTDVYYKVERKRYPEIVANIINRSFDRPIYRTLDYTVKNNIQFNHFLEWQFADNKNWMLTNCKWDIDNGFTSVSALENYYAIKTGSNIPPVVEAGEDQHFEDRNGMLTCEAFDPDGHIVSYEWKVISGGNEVTILNPNSQNTEFRILGGSVIQAYYEFEITVTDNEGATASDRVKFYRNTDVVISLEEIYSISDGGGGADLPFSEKHYKVIFNPEVPLDTAINIEGNLIATFRGLRSQGQIALTILERDGTVIDQADAMALPNNSEMLFDVKQPFSRSFYRGTEMIFKMRAYSANEIWDDTLDPAYQSGEIILKIEINNVQYTTGAGEITGFPIAKEVSIGF